MENDSRIPAAAVLLAATMLGVGVIGGGHAAQGGKACGNDKDCFAAQFAECQPARFTSDKHLDAQVRYRITGLQNDQCAIQVQFLAHPKPAWVGKPLNMVLDPAKPMGPQLKDAVGQCLANAAPGDYQCSGPLRGARNWGPAREGDGPMDEAAAVERHRAKEARSAKPAGPACGTPVDVSGEPLYALPRNGRWGYVNRAGEWVIEPQWSQAEPFSEGRAAVAKGNSRHTYWGVIDRSGDYVVKPRLQSASVGGPRIDTPPIKPFSQGCAAVSPRDGAHHPYFVTRDGQFWLRDALPESLADRDVKEFGSFSQGLAWFRVFDMKNPEHYGYINTRGEIAIDVKYAHAGDFVDGLAPAEIKNDLWGYIDTDGELAWPGKWQLAGAETFADGLALVRLKNDEYAYFNGDELVIKKLQFDPPRAFGESDGEQAVETAPIAYADGFGSGLAAVAVDGHASAWLYMDKQGNAAFAPGADLGLTVCYGSRNINARFDTHRLRFRHGLARLRVANENGECDEPSVVDGRFETHAQSHYIYIDTDGDVVLEEPYRDGDTDARPQPRGNKQ